MMAAGVGLLVPSVSSAHIKLVFPSYWLSRDLIGTAVPRLYCKENKNTFLYEGPARAYIIEAVEEYLSSGKKGTVSNR